MRIWLSAMLLMGAPAPKPAPVPAPAPPAAKVLGPMAPQYDYDSAPVAGMAPLMTNDVIRVLKSRRSFPEHSRVPAWHQRNGASRMLVFRAARKPGTGTVTNAECEPTPCQGKYSIVGNVVTIDFKPRAGVMRLSLFRSPAGVAMMFDDWGPVDGRVSPW